MHKPDLSARLSQAGRQRVIDKFDWRTVDARYLEIMDQCIHAPDV